MPGLLKRISPISGVKDVIRKGREKIREAGEDIKSVAGELHEETQTNPGTPSVADRPATRSGTVPSGVSDADTLKYQLKHLIDALDQLGLHLSEECKIMDVPCDCCEKHASRIRGFALETIPIAARQGKDTEVFTEIAEWSSYIEEIGTEENSISGQYGSDYRAESGKASGFAKQLRKMKSEIQDENCPSCAETKETLTKFIEERKRKV